MKLTTAIIMFLLTLFVQSFGQDWIPEFLNGKWDKVDSLVNELRNEMMKEIGNKAPELVFHNIETNNAKSLSDYKENVLIVNFWSTSCGNCRKQLPELSKLHKQYNDKELKVILISQDNIDSLNKYYKKYPTEGIKTVMYKKDVESLKRPYQFFAKPSAFIVDKNGIVQDAWLGPETYDALEKRILPFVQK